jgi:hypothetical protein
LAIDDRARVNDRRRPRGLDRRDIRVSRLGKSNGQSTGLRPARKNGCRSIAFNRRDSKTYLCGNGLRRAVGPESYAQNAPIRNARPRTASQPVRLNNGNGVDSDVAVRFAPGTEAYRASVIGATVVPATAGPWRRQRDARTFDALTSARRRPKAREANPLPAKPHYWKVIRSIGQATRPRRGDRRRPKNLSGRPGPGSSRP